MAASLWAVGVTIISTVIGACGSLFLKLGAQQASWHPWRLLRNGKLLLGFLLYGTAAILFIIALKGGELSALYPLASLGYLWVTFLSVKVVGERMNALKWIGISLIIFGVIFVGSSYTF